ncbi:hypothetical protein [Pseudomonas putida]|uniref:Uncharacterized protein n=1 Tax=Pseudomonas putida TaxID=303 RepID=A0A8I1JG18_PSEPU|nr:hypothetical protein [Pseudomonas putida]MBI6882367.1 hypothetical protein [Pseudomonas putida]
MADQPVESSFAAQISRVVASSFSNASEQDFKEVVKTIWYSEENLVETLSFVISHRLEGDDQKRRLLYMVERFRRFGCVTQNKKKALRDFVQEWSHLQPDHVDARSMRLVEDHRLEEMACSWGLNEDLSARLQEVLRFQTRHYADTVGSRNGYSEAEPE